MDRQVPYSCGKMFPRKAGRDSRPRARWTRHPTPLAGGLRRRRRSGPPSRSSRPRYTDGLPVPRRSDQALTPILDLAPLCDGCHTGWWTHVSGDHTTVIGAETQLVDRGCGIPGLAARLVRIGRYPRTRACAPNPVLGSGRGALVPDPAPRRVEATNDRHAGLAKPIRRIGPTWRET